MSGRMDEIRGRWAKATPGPWKVDDDHGGKRNWRSRVVATDPESLVLPWSRLVADCYYPGGEGESAEAIAHAPADVAALLQVLEDVKTALNGPGPVVTSERARLNALGVLAAFDADWFNAWLNGREAD